MELYPLAVAEAQIRHRRYVPKAYAFAGKLSYLYFDPERLGQISASSPLWSSKGWNLLSLKPEDFLSQFRGSIREKIQQVLIREQCNGRLVDIPPIGQIRILALPRTLGFRFNSVVFYFLFDSKQRLQMILSEITNTPWLERQVYVHDCRGQGRINSAYVTYGFQFKKAFHVSPFMPMDLDYNWRFSFSGTQHVVFMQLFQNKKLQFDATLRFQLYPITLPSQQHRYAVSKIFEPFKMVAGIYYHAFKLWRNKVPFYRHPKKIKDRL